MTSNNGSGTKRLDKNGVKAAATGRWTEIIPTVCGVADGLLDGTHHACPKCGGTDRFRAYNDFADTGGVICNQCHAKNNQDGFATVMWLTGTSFTEAVSLVAIHLGVAGVNGQRIKSSILELVSRAKQMPIDAMVAYGAKAAKRGKIEVVRCPVHNESGEIHSYFDLAPNAKGWFKKGTGNSGIFLPGRLPNPGETWLVVEGVKDACAWHSLGFNTLGTPTNYLDAKYVRLLSDVHVVVAPDRDKAGDDGAMKTGANLHGVSATTKIATLPAPYKERRGDDARDILKNRDGEQLLRRAISTAAPWRAEDVKASDVGKPQIAITPDEEAVTTEAVAALATRQDVFQRGGMLVHLVRDSEPPKALRRSECCVRILKLPSPRLREVLASTATWIRFSDGEPQTVHPPQWAVNAVESRGQWPNVPTLTSVAESPIVLADGSVIEVPGHHQDTGIFYVPSCDFKPVAEKPSHDDAIKARDELLGVVCDFPFASEHHQASWLAYAITPTAVHAFDGPTPLFAIDANTRGTGKSLLADIVSVIHTGGSAAKTSVPRDDEEMRKRLTAIIIEGSPIVLFDNVAGCFGSASLDAALTAEVWSDRLLGISQTTGRLLVNTIWAATGNNLQFAADTARRVLHIRIESPMERPEERDGFKHPRLVLWTKQNRGSLASAAATIVKAYILAGRPDQSLPQWGSFEGWSDLVRSAVVWVGMLDSDETRQQLQEESDRSAGELRMMIAGWQEADSENNGMTVGEALHLLDRPIPDGKSDPYPTLRNAIAEITTRGKPNTRAIGMKLHHMARRICGGLRFTRHSRKGTAAWSIEEAGKPNQGGTSGTNLHHLTREEVLSMPMDTQSYGASKGGRSGTSPTSPVSPTSAMQPCNHNDPTSWVHRDGKAFCRGCDRFMGRVK